MSHVPDPLKPPAETSATPPVADPRLDVEALRLLLDVSRRINAERDAAALPTAVIDSLVTVTKADRGFLVLKEGAASASRSRATARGARSRPTSSASASRW